MVTYKVARAVLLAGAAGDALGDPVEFMSIEQIRRRFGPAGIEAPVGDHHVTDDTQMSLFSAEGCLRAARGEAFAPALWHAYLRWLITQGEGWPASLEPEVDGWLVDERVLRARRAPGATCLAALRSGRMGTVEAPLNDSAGCGGLMRAAPFGLTGDPPPVAFERAVAAAALTHGSSAGYLPAGVLAALVAAGCAGSTFEEAWQTAMALLPAGRSSAGVRRRLDAGIALAERGPCAPEELTAALGEGWVGHEALAIAIYAVRSHADPTAALLAAVNHSGDSDSTGSIVGNLIGAFGGLDRLPRGWWSGLDALGIIEQMATDLSLDPNELEDDRYPRRQCPSGDEPVAVPPSDAPWEAIWRFARSGDAYETRGGFEPLAALANSAVERWGTDASLPDNLDDARAALFFEQRRYHHVGEHPTGEDERYVRALVARIGELSVGSIEWHPR